MVGITMVLAIAICIFGAAGLFAWFSRPFSDLIPVVAPAAQVQPTAAPAGSAGQPPAQGDEQAIEAQAQPTQPPPAEPTVSPPVDEFQPTHQIASGQSVNFRTGPSVADSVIIALPPATPLQYLDEDAPTSGPNEGDRWMRFRTEDGQEGWVLEILTEPYQP
jgi:hypothetical protein